MEKIQEFAVTSLKNGEIEVKNYLTYAEIQSICNAVCKFDTWAERQENIDVLLLHFATNLTDKEIEEIGHDVFVQSGLMDKIKACVLNFNKIEEAINYTQSTQRALTQILKEMPKMLDSLKKVKPNGGKK